VGWGEVFLGFTGQRPGRARFHVKRALPHRSRGTVPRRTICATVGETMVEIGRSCEVGLAQTWVP